MTPLTFISRLLITSTLVNAYNSDQVLELVYLYSFSSSQWHYTMLFIPDIAGFDMKYYGVSPHNLWSFP